MPLQALIVACVVALCAIASIWMLLPAAARRAVARAALRLPWPAPAKARWRRAAAAPSGCAGCAHGSGQPAPPIHVVRKAAPTGRG